MTAALALLFLFCRVGDLHAGIDVVSCSIEPLLEMAERDERDHDLGEAPYPPSFPKMPGEPKRVQPSRARSDDEAEQLVRGTDD